MLETEKIKIYLLSLKSSHSGKRADALTHGAQEGTGMEWHMELELARSGNGKGVFLAEKQHVTEHSTLESSGTS